MKSLNRATAGVAIAASITFGAHAQNNQVPVIDGPTYMMTYVEVIPSTTNQAIAALKDYRDASRKEQGANFVDIYQEDGQSYRFVVSEVWQNRGAAKAHADLAARKTTGSTVLLV